MIFNRLNRVADRIFRSVASTPLALLPFSSRSIAIERLSERMIYTTKTDAGPISFFCPSPLLTMRAETLLKKEPDMIQWIKSFEADSVFWDVGANVGVFSLYASIRRPITVVAFEPSAANFHVLSRNILLNRLNDRVIAYCVALSGKTKLGVLNMLSAAMGSAQSQFGQPGEMSPYAPGGEPGLIHGMVGFTMDDFIEQFRPPFPNYLKIDVDGLEWMILQGGIKTLKDPRLRSIIVELTLTNEDEYHQSLELLKACGLDFVSKGEIQGNQHIQGSEQVIGANHLFVRRA